MKDPRRLLVAVPQNFPLTPFERSPAAQDAIANLEADWCALALVSAFPRLGLWI
jgi:hypothetical protein